MNDAELIEGFKKDRGEAAFRLLVERHLSLVLGTARRITGDNGLAEEVAQTVFILLTRKAPSFGRTTVVSGWLYRTTCFVARRAVRGERRRQRREQEAVAMQTHGESMQPMPELAPHLDDALQRLSTRERNAVLLRFYEERSLSEVGTSLGISEEAAKKRVTRGLEKLRRFFSRRGTQITTVALAGAITQQTARAAVSAAAVSKVTAGALAPGASSALLADVLRAWRWARIKVALGVSSGAVATVFLMSHVIPAISHRNATGVASQAVPAGAARDNTPAPADTATADGGFGTMELYGQKLPAHGLRITILDKATGEPIVGAEVRNSLMSRANREDEPRPLLTDAKGTVAFAVPDHTPGDDRVNQFAVFVEAKNYASREIIWLCSTGAVFNIVTNGYTAHLERGISLSGIVTGEDGQPQKDVEVGVFGNNYPGFSYSTDGQGKVISPPVLRVGDYASISRSSDGHDAALTDRDGRFRFEHAPSELRSLVIDLTGPDGARRKFRTLPDARYSVEESAEVSIDELAAGSAKLVLPHGITVEGLVTDTSGEPVPGASVSEGRQWGNLNILSTSYTDHEGRFWLSNRQPHEIILAASGEGYASASTIVAIKKGVKPVHIELPPEQPLKGNVVNESGEPISGSDVKLYDICNKGLGMKWSAKTDSNGRFEWRGAPTNEVALMVSAQNYTGRLVRLHATTNEQAITLSTVSVGNAAHVTGTVADATSGEPIKQFTLEVCHSHAGIYEMSQTVEGVDGHFNVNTLQSEVAVGNYAVWYLLFEADGYEPLATRDYDYNEGDQKLEIKLQRGGTIEGQVRSPEGELVSGCDVGIGTSNEWVASLQPGKFPLGSPASVGRSDSNGHFKFAKPYGAKSVIFFDQSGWAAVPMPANSQSMDIHLLRWGRIEGTLMTGNRPIPNERVGLENLIGDYDRRLQILQDASTDESGRFVFEKVPAGEYQVAFEPKDAQRVGYGAIRTLQRGVRVSAGQTNFVVLAASGQTVVAKLQVRDPNTATDWSNCVAALERDVSIPPAPIRGDFITDVSYEAAQSAYTHDPVVIRATGETRSYLGEVAPDGSAVFENVPPGNYHLDVKLLSKANSDSDSYRPPKETDGLRAAASIPEDRTGNTNAVNLGTFMVEGD